jgi:hypothetical protein
MVMLLLMTVAACGRSSPATAPAAPRIVETPAGVELRIDAERIVLANGLVERRWTRTPYRTESLTDLRSGRNWSGGGSDIALAFAGLDVADRFNVSGEPQVETLPGGALRVTSTLVPAGLSVLPLGFRIRRSVEMYPGIAGMRQDTRLETTLPLLLSGYTLDQAQTQGEGLAAQMHSFRAGADWREPEWQRPPLLIGDAHGGSWRQTTSGDRVAGTAQWLSVTAADGASLFYVLERNDLASSTMSFEEGRARAGVDFGRDVIYLGPLEESAHIENPGSGPGRHRALLPGAPMRLEPVFTGLGRDADDEPWQHYKYLAERRMPPYRREITFNSNNVDSNRISTGAKDDMDFAAFEQQLAVARQIGIETFIFDDGWQARSGDWCPDADVPDERCHDPRRGRDAKFGPRFPDAEFVAVQQQLRPAGMNLGLWMSPLHFHPSAQAFRDNPQWLCLPISAALLLVNQAQPEDGSNEAGIVQWNPEALGAGGKAIDHIESRIRRAIDDWGVRYFKFDFTAWFDCAGVYPVDMYAYRESFMAMLDRVLADHPEVTIQMDETNDYRLFPFEALARGPTWYQNGSPEPRASLHANWLLAPWLPPYALGRAALRSGDLDTWPVDYQMAVALLSHITFFNDLTEIPEAARPRIRAWMDYYRQHREHFAGFTYPLLDEDPYAGTGWAAFQPWNPETGRGALLVYRQDTEEGSRVIRLRNLPEGRYRLLEAPGETQRLEADAAQLRQGIEVSIPARHSARVFRIERL